MDRKVLAGVQIRSERLLPGLPVDGEWDLDVAIRFVPQGIVPAEARADSRVGAPLPDGACALPASTQHHGWIRRDGREVVIVGPPTGIGDAALAVRSVLPFASALQGGIVLHASAVAFPDGVHAFVGASGVGKSTLAANLAALGVPGVADDLTPCRLEVAGVRVLLPAALAGGATCPALRAIHFLSRSRDVGRVRHDALTAAACLPQLLWHGFSDLASRDLWAKHFAACAELARRVPAYALVLPDDYPRRQEVAADVRDLLTAPSPMLAAR